MSMAELAQLGLLRLEWAIFFYFLAVNSFYAVLLLSAAWELRDHVHRTRAESRWRMLSSRVAPRISMLAPAYNEAATVGQSVRGLLTLRYANLELILINDGSRDGTMDVLQREFALRPVTPLFRQLIPNKPIRALYRSATHPELLVIDKENGGKADALNAGLNLARGELVCAMDADTIIEPDALLRMVRPFLLMDDTVAAGGTIRIANGCQVHGGRIVTLRAPRRPIPGFQVIEYLRAFLFGRLGWNRLGGNLIISGAFGLFNRAAVLEAGGYTHDTVGEDMELVLKLRRNAYEKKTPGRVAFVPDPVAWTEAPETLRVLGRQRDRWHRGLADTLWRHRRCMLNPRYGALGMIAYPYFVFIELLAPLVELIGFLGLLAGLIMGAINFPFAVLFFLVAYGFGALLSALTLILEDVSYRRYPAISDRFVLFGWTLLENIGYRQLTVLWRIRGLWKFLRGNKQWGAMERRGIGSAAASSTGR